MTLTEHAGPGRMSADPGERVDLMAWRATQRTAKDLTAAPGIAPPRRDPAGG